jgi:predicted O-linked N-acetylglucosamine transferase (SPINDLY family)
MPELITASLEAYEALARRLAQEPQTMAGLKRRLAERRGTAPLFDGARYARHIEAAYLTMQERATRGLPPESFAVAAL